MAKARTLVLNTKVNVTGADELRGLGKTLQRTGGLLTAGLTLPLVGFGAAMLTAAEDAARAEAKLTNVFDSMGAAAFTSIKALNEHAKALQNTTTFDDEAITASQAVLLTFGKVTGESFTRATEAALDLSSLFEGDLQTATIQIGKALNDPIKGITALSKAGVSFTEQQKEQIKVMVQSGDVLGAQNIILGELEKQFGGTAEAIAGTAGGQMTQALNQLGEASEEFGKILAPVLVEVASGLKEFAKWLQTLNPETKQWVIRIAALAAALGPVLVVVGTLVRTFAGLQTAGLLLIRTAPLIGAAFHAMLGPIGLVTGAIALLAAGFATDFLGMRTDLETAVDDIAMNFGDMRDDIHKLANEAGTDFHSMKDDIHEAMEESGTSFDEVVERIEAGLSATGEALQQSSSVAHEWSEDQKTAYAALNTAVSDSMDLAVGDVTTGVDAMADEIGLAPGKMADELLAAQFELTDATTELVNFMDQALTPAQERFQIQGFLASGELAEALTSNNPLIRTKAEEMQQAAIDRLAEIRGAFWSSGSSAAYAFGQGMTDQATIDFVSGSAARMAAAARGIFPDSEPKDPSSPFRGITKGFGFGDILAKGLLTGQGAVTGAFRTLTGGGMTMPGIGTLSPAAGGGGGQVVNNFYLQWDGESPKGRSEAEIIATLQRLIPMVDTLKPVY